MRWKRTYCCTPLWGLQRSRSNDEIQHPSLPSARRSRVWDTHADAQARVNLHRRVKAKQGTCSSNLRLNHTHGLSDLVQTSSCPSHSVMLTFCSGRPSNWNIWMANPWSSKIPPYSNSGETIEVKKRGLPRQRGGGRGDVVVLLKLHMPKKVPKSTKSNWNRFAAI